MFLSYYTLSIVPCHLEQPDVESDISRTFSLELRLHVCITMSGKRISCSTVFQR